MLNFKKIFRPICWLQEVYRTIRTGKLVAGHDYLLSGDDPFNDSLVCEICGHVSGGNNEFKKNL